MPSPTELPFSFLNLPLLLPPLHNSPSPSAMPIAGPPHQTTRPASPSQQLGLCSFQMGDQENPGTASMQLVVNTFSADDQPIASSQPASAVPSLHDADAATPTALAVDADGFCFVCFGRLSFFLPLSHLPSNYEVTMWAPASPSPADSLVIGS